MKRKRFASVLPDRPSWMFTGCLFIFLSLTNSLAQMSGEEAFLNVKEVQIFNKSLQFVLPSTLSDVKEDTTRYPLPVIQSAAFKDKDSTSFKFVEFDQNYANVDNGLSILTQMDKFTAKFPERSILGSGYRNVHSKKIYYMKFCMKDKKNNKQFAMLFHFELKGKVVYALLQTRLAERQQWSSFSTIMLNSFQFL